MFGDMTQNGWSGPLTDKIQITIKLINIENCAIWTAPSVFPSEVHTQNIESSHISPLKNSLQATNPFCSLTKITLSNMVKVKWFRYRPGVTQRVGRGIALLFHDCGTRRGWVISITLRPHFTPGKDRYPFYRRLGGPQGRSGRAENLVPTGIRSRAVQPVVSRYTDWATGPAQVII